MYTEILKQNKTKAAVLPISKRLLQNGHTLAKNTSGKKINKPGKTFAAVK